MIIYTCPKCGENLMSYVITTFPPINVKECCHCGWRHEDNPQDIMYIQFPEEEEKNDLR